MSHRRGSGLNSDRPRSPQQPRKGSENMRMAKDHSGRILDDVSKERKSVNVLDGEYQLLEIIGEGSFGHVYEAKHNRTGRIVAIKKFKNKYQNRKKAFE